MKAKAQTIAAIFFIPLFLSLTLFQEMANTANANNQHNDTTPYALGEKSKITAESETFSITVNIIGSGTVTKEPDKASYNIGDTVKLYAVPNTGYKFVGWSGDVSGTDSPEQLVVTGNHTVIATFEERCYALSLFYTGFGKDPVADPTNSIGCELGKYKVGTLINLLAEPDPHWTVNSWLGTNANSSNSTANSVTMPPSAQAVTVNYGPICFALNTTILPTGKGTIARLPATDANCPAGQYIEETPVQLTATAEPGTGYIFKNWSGDATGLTSQISVIMNKTRNITANFTLACYSLTLTHTGSGDNPFAIPTNSPECNNGEYIINTPISLTANPASGWLVENWKGTANDSSSSTSNSLKMPASNHLAAVNYIEKPTIQFSAASYSFNEDIGNAVVQVTRTGSPKGTVTVDYTTVDVSSALAGLDYTETKGTLTFEPNVTELSINVPILDDILAEGSEFFNLTLANVSGNGKFGALTTAKVTIGDDEGEPTIQFNPTSFIANESSPTKGITVTLFPASTSSVFVEFFTQDGSATGGKDYSPTTRTIRFWPNETSHVVNVPIKNDKLDEPDESVLLRLSDVENAALGESEAVLTIVDDDAPPTTQFSKAEYFAKEGDPVAPISVTLSATSAFSITINYEVTQVTVGLQFVDKITFDPGEMIKVIQVPISDKKDGDELNILLKNAENATLGPPSSARLQILDKNRSECFPLTMSFTGYGLQPVATNIDHSIGCPVDHYVTGELINIEAGPDPGWSVASWYGTLNDASKAQENVVRMPNGEHTVAVHYITSHYLANISSSFISYFEGPEEVEPNNLFADANGPIESGKIYFGSLSSADDNEDRFYFYTPKGGNVQIKLTDIPSGTDYNLYLYDTNWNRGHIGYSGSLDNNNESITKSISPGQYYIRVIRAQGEPSSSLYKLQADFD